MTTEHDHSGFEETDPDGRGVDTATVSGLVGAAFDGCDWCQARHLGVLAGDAVSTARLVELACMLTVELVGGVPATMYDDDTPGVSSPAFRMLVRTGKDGANNAMYALAQRMPPERRREAAETALDTIVGHLTVLSLARLEEDDEVGR